MTSYRIWPSTDGPLTSVTDGQPLNLAHEFHVTSGPVWLTHIHFFRGNTDIIGTITGRIWEVLSSSTGSLIAGTEVTFTLSGVGWHTAALSTPLLLSTSKRYKASVSFPDRWPLTGAYWTSGPGASGLSNGPLAFYSAAAGLNSQGSYSASASTNVYPATSGVGGNYWIDVSITDVDPAGQSITAASVTADAAVGQAVLTPGTVDIAAASLAATGAIGQAVVTPGEVTISAASLAADAAVGQAVVSPGAVDIAAAALVADAVIGGPTITPGGVTVEAASLVVTAAVGQAEVSPGVVVIGAPSLLAPSAIGEPTITPVIQAASLVATAAIGQAVVAPGGVTISPPSLTATGVVGMPAINLADQRPESLSVVLSEPRVDWALGVLEVV